MIVIMQHGASRDQVQAVVDRVSELGFSPHPLYGEERTVIAVIGDERPVDESVFKVMAGVDRVVRILKPFKLASRDFHPEDTIVPINGCSIGGKQIIIMAGPCSVESKEQMLETAWAVKEAGVDILRGGAFKPRTSPYSFQGLGEKGLEILAEVKQETGLAIVTEVVAPEQVSLVGQYADILQVGTRNMQNYSLLHAVGEFGKPVLLKRGMMSTIDELLMAAEYILSHGNYRVILCERGIRTFETRTRNTLDISAVPVLKQNTHLPVIIDPSHATGNWEWVEPLAMAGVAAGADGMIIEVHPHPDKALSDGAQSLRLDRFAEMVRRVRAVAEAVGRTV